MVLIAGKCLAMPSEWSHRKSWWWRWRSRTSCIPHTWLIDILMFFVKKMMLLIYVYIFIYNRIHTQLGIVRHWSFSHNSPYPAAFCPCHPCHFVTMTDPPRGATLAVGTLFFHYPCCSAWFTTQLQMVKTCFSTSEQLSAGFSLPHLIQVNISSTGALPWVARGNVRTQSRRRALKIASELVEWFLWRYSLYSHQYVWEYLGI